MNTALLVHAKLPPDDLKKILSTDETDSYLHQGAPLFSEDVQAFLAERAEFLAGVLGEAIEDGNIRQFVPLFQWIMRRDALRIAKANPDQPAELIIDEVTAAFNLYVCGLLDLTVTDFYGEQPFRKVKVAHALVAQQVFAAQLNLPLGTLAAANDAVNRKTA